MRWLALLALAVVATGCNDRRVIDRASLDTLYTQTALAEDAASFVPLQLDRNNGPARVVTWYYAGTKRGQHLLVLRELRLDTSPWTQSERRYVIDASLLSIERPMERTHDQQAWMLLHEAASGLQPPADALTTRILPGKADGPRTVEPRQNEPEPIDPVDLPAPASTRP